MTIAESDERKITWDEKNLAEMAASAALSPAETAHA